MFAFIRTISHGLVETKVFYFIAMSDMMQTNG